MCWTGGVTQEVMHLLCKHEALSSNPHPSHLAAKDETYVAIQMRVSSCLYKLQSLR
jgi:hypothetical protein